MAWLAVAWCPGGRWATNATPSLASASASTAAEHLRHRNPVVHDHAGDRVGVERAAAGGTKSWSICRYCRVCTRSTTSALTSRAATGPPHRSGWLDGQPYRTARNAYWSLWMAKASLVVVEVRRCAQEKHHDDGAPLILFDR